VIFHRRHLALSGGVLSSSFVLDVADLRLRRPMGFGLAGEHNLSPVTNHRSGFDLLVFYSKFLVNFFLPA
jgi:hypothetical protein